MKKVILAILLAGLLGCSDQQPTHSSSPVAVQDTSTIAKVETVASSVVSYITTPAPVETPTTKTVNDEPSISSKALALITDSEVSATDADHRYYDKHYQTLTWPGADSGPTLGIGVDAGQQTGEYTTTCWTPYLTPTQVKTLASFAGHSGSQARADVRNNQNIIVVWDDARDEFVTFEIASYKKQCERVFKGFDDITFNAQGAIISLVYNRGYSMVGSNRSEMRDIRDYGVPDKDYQRIANDINHMDRIWEGTDIYQGMVSRRKAESNLTLTPDS